MTLRFELGDAQAPRGHALLYARAGGSDGQVMATYCVVLPLQFSIGKYLPPILAGQMPLEAMQQGIGGASAMPIPPMLEDIPALDDLRALAERRDDDLCDLGTVVIGDDSHRLGFAAEACGEYGQLYADYQRRWPATPSRVTPLSATPQVGTSATPLDDLNVDDVVATMLPERARLGEMARLIGEARYAIEVGDTQQRERAHTELERLARTLPEKYRALRMVEAALRTDASGPRLAELYLLRAYKLLDEQYIDIPPIERDIRAIDGDEDEHPGESAR